MRDFRRVWQKCWCLGLLASAVPLLFGAEGPQKAQVGMRNSAAEAVTAQVDRTFGKLPLSFEENRGQADRQVKFVSQGQGYSMFLTSSGVVLSLQTSSSPSKAGQHALIRMGFSGAQCAAVTGEEQQTARSSYFIGNDPAKWVTGAANYARVRYRALYPGVDLVFYGKQRQLEYDLVVAPGADPRAIGLKFDGVDRVRVDSAGNLVLSAGKGEIRQHRPIIYQERDGVRQPVDGRYVIQPGNRVAFAVARYDRRQPLIIDPVLSFATYLGTDGIFNISSNPATTTTSPAVAVDFQGSVYVAGFNGGGTATFPGPPVVLPPGGSDVYVAKMNSTGTALLYSVVFGGGGPDIGGGIAVDGSGNAYVTGFTNSSNLPVSENAKQPNNNGTTNAFVAKVNAAGNLLAYCTYLGGNGSDWGRAIAVDHSGNAYVTGTAQESSGTTFPLVNAISSTPAPGFLTEVNSTGTDFVYSTFLSAGIGYGIAVDSTGAAYVTGTTGTNLVLIPTPTAAQGFVLKVNADGGTLAYGPVLLGSVSQQTIGFGIALDAQNDAYVTGMTTDPNFPQITAGAPQTTYGGGLTDAFALELDPSGDLPPVYGTYIGGLGSNSFPERGSGIGVDVDGYAYVAGTSQCIGFPTTNAIAGANGTPTVLMKGTLSGSSSTWSATSLAGSFDQVTALAFDALGNLYAGASASNVTTGGGVYKLVSGTWSSASSGINSTTIDSIAVDPNNASIVYAAGGGHLYQTINGGTGAGSWTQLAQAVGTSAVIAIAKTSTSTVYVGSSNGLIYSTSPATSWSSPATPPGVGAVSAVIVDPNSPSTAYAGTPTGVYKTTDGGAHWNATGSLGATTGLAINGSGTIYAATATAAGLYYTTNGGTSWNGEQASLNSSEIVSTPTLVAVDASNTVYLAFQGGGVATGTIGSWSTLTYSGLPHSNQVMALAVQPSSPYTPYAGIVSATDAFLTRISPGGGSFSFSTCIGGSDNDLGQNIAVTPTGTVYISGATISTNLPVTGGIIQSSLSGQLYGDFVAKVDNEPFTDVSPSNGFFKFINAMYERGITAGCAISPLQYCPDSVTTRAEMAVFIIAAIEGGNSFSYTTTPYFADVQPTDPFFKFIQKMKDLGITAGCSATLYCPNDPVTRGQMAVFIIKGRYGTINFSALPSYSATQLFSDVPPSSPFYPFIQKMAETAITAGCGSGMFCPDAPLTRGQMAVFIITGLLNQMLPIDIPVITEVFPNSGSPGQNVTVTVAGIGSQFAQGVTQVAVPTGITASNVIVASATSLTVQLNISPSAVLSNTAPAGSPYSIVVTTGSAEAMLPNGFIVQ